MQERYVGNIVTAYNKSKFPNLFNVVKSFEEKIDGLPTLIIGLDNAKEYISGFSILTKKYEDGLIWWTYKKTERKYDFDNDTVDFYSYSVQKFLSEIRYRYLNIPQYRYSEIKRILDWIKSDSEKTCFLTRESNFLFIYDVKLKTVFGLSLTLCEYIWVPRKKVVSLVKSNKNNRFVYDTSFIDSDIRQIIGNNTHYILPLQYILQSE